MNVTIIAALQEGLNVFRRAHELAPVPPRGAAPTWSRILRGLTADGAEGG